MNPILSHINLKQECNINPHSRTTQIHKHTLLVSLSMAKVNRLPLPFIGRCVCEDHALLSRTQLWRDSTAGRENAEKKRKGRKIRPVVPLIESFGPCLLRSVALLQESGFMLS